MTHNTGLSDSEYKRIQKIMREWADAIKAVHVALATNYNTPAQRIINCACSQMGISRLDWEKIECVEGDVLYEKPPQRILDRWMRY